MTRTQNIYAWVIPMIAVLSLISLFDFVNSLVVNYQVTQLHTSIKNGIDVRVTIEDGKWVAGKYGDKCYSDATVDLEHPVFFDTKKDCLEFVAK